MIDLFVVGRAVGKTTFTLETMYREPDWLLVVSDGQQIKHNVDRLTDRCLEDGPPPWFEEPVAPVGTQAGFWRRFWEARITTPGQFFRTHGVVRRPKVAIDNLDHVLGTMFGNVQMATATGIIPRRSIPSLPRTKCAACGGPYDEETDSLGLCSTCITDEKNWGSDGA